MSPNDREIADLIRRLRQEGASAFNKHYSLGMYKLCADAADTIEDLHLRLSVCGDHAPADLDAVLKESPNDQR